MTRPHLIVTCLLVSGMIPAIVPAVAAAQNAFDWIIEDTGSVNEMFVLTEFHTDIVNTGTQTDTYRVELVRNMSTNWTTTMCDTTICYRPSITTLEYVVAPGESVFVGINITPAVDPGAGTSVVTVSSLTDPELSRTAEFRVVSTGLDVLLVDADGGDDAETYHEAALAGSGLTHAVWDRAQAGKLAPVELETYSAVVWAAAGNPRGLDDDDRAALSAYVLNGGRLFLSGQDLAWAAADPTSPWFSPTAVDWLRDVLQLEYERDDMGTTQVFGWPGDEVGNGLLFDITGGDGGDGNDRPDAVTAVGAGVRFLIHNSGLAAGVRAATGLGKTVFLAFGFEGIDTSASRQDLMDAAMAWFAEQASAAPDVPFRGLGSARAVPNPFNPRTSLSFEVGGSGGQRVAVIVYDVSGRVVRRLHDGRLDSGPARIDWDGRDDTGRTVAGGIYLARISAGESERRVKMVLAK